MRRAAKTSELAISESLTNSATSDSTSRALPLHNVQRAAGNRAVAAALADRGGGQPLHPAVRSLFEPLFARSFSDVRVHNDTRAASLVASIGARAFTRGADVYFGEGKYQPDTSDGRTLIAHELTHTVQQDAGASTSSDMSGHDDRDEQTARIAATRVTAGRPLDASVGTAQSSIQRDDPPPGYRETDDPDHPLEAIDPQDTDDLAFETPFPIELAAHRPELMIVPTNATRRMIAARLLGDERLDGEFDFAVPPGGGRAVRMRHPDALVAEARQMMIEQLETQLTTDVAWVTGKLQETWIDDDDELSLTENCLRWSQRSDIHDGESQSFFERYLDSLANTTVSSGLIFTTTRTALEALIAETSRSSEQILKAITLRSSRDVGYTVVDQQPSLAPGDVAGRFYFSSGSSVQLLVAETLAAEPTRERAETVVRNSATTGLRVVIPGSDGMFYGYHLIDTTIDDLMIPRPEDDPTGNYYWYFPGTIAILPGQFDADFPQGTTEAAEQRRLIVGDALSMNNLAALLDLDFPALSTATNEQRVTMLALAMPNVSGSRTADFIARVIYTTPDAEFPALSRIMSERGLIEQFVRQTMTTPELAVVGRIFSTKTMTALPVGAQSITDMVSFTLGYDQDQTYHFAHSGVSTVDSTLVAPAAWNPQSAIRVGNEPAGPGETAGPVRRQAITFQRGILLGGMGNLVTNSSEMAQNDGPLTRPLLPTELVEIHIIGAQPRTIIASALEASSLLALHMSDYARQVIMPAVDLNVLAMTGLGLARAFGPALAEGLAAGGVRAGVAAVAEQAATQGGRAAVRSAIIGTVLVGGSRAIDTYREELEQSEAGRALIAAWNVAMLALVAKDVYQIATSGLIGRISELASRTYSTLSEGAAARLRNAIDDLHALQLAAQRMGEAERTAPVLAGVGNVELGNTAMSMAERPQFGQLFMAARAQVRSAAVVTTLSEAGASTVVAERVFGRLQVLSNTSREMARAQRIIAGHVAGLSPAALDEYLLAVETTLAARPGAGERVAGFLSASTRAADPVAYLGDVQWLLARGGVAADAIQTLGEKAARGRLDLGWLRTTTLTDRDLSYLGQDANTPWEVFQRLSQGSTDIGDLIWAMRSTRGAAAEIVARRGAATYFPGNRISGSQVDLAGSRLDFVLTSTDGLARRRGLEVKGFTQEVWRESLGAFQRREAGVVMTESEAAMADRIDRMLRQLQNAQTALGNSPVLAISDGIRAVDEQALRALIQARLPGCQIVKMSNTAIVDMGNQLRTRMGIPLSSSGR